MVSQSARSKLKIVFFVNVIIVAIAVPSYFYAGSQIPDPASFQVTDLVLDSDLIQVGDSVQLSVNVTNLGDQMGNHSITLTIDGEPITTKTVQLSGSESVTVDFDATIMTEGNHTVQVADLTASFEATLDAPAKPAKMQVTDLGVSRAIAEAGETIVVSATVTNIGDEGGSFDLDLFVNDEKRETKSIQLDSKETTTVQFNVTEEAEGTYVVKVGDLTESFEISSNAQPAKPAEFQVTDLTINPSSVMAGESVAISVKVTNVGEETGTYSVNLKIDGTTADTRSVTLSGAATQLIEFSVTETTAGTHTVEVDNETGSFTVEAPVVASDKIDLLRVFVTPYEVAEGDTVTVRVKANNMANEEAVLGARLLVDGEVADTKTSTLPPGESEEALQFTVTAGPANAETAKGYSIEVINLGNQSDKLKGYYTVAPDGFHTFSLSTNAIGMKFTINGVTEPAPYSKLLPEGTYTITIPDGLEGGGTFWNFTNWMDGPTDLTRTLTLDRRLSLIANFMNCKSCPSLYVWDGADYVYTAEISDGTGYLGIFDYFREDGSLSFLYSVPWDYVKLDASILQQNDGYYDMTIRQNWDEISYVDSATLVIVEHSPDVDVYSTKATYLYEPEGQGTIYTVSKNPDAPLSCVNGTGHDVLPLILERDGITTLGNEFMWDTLELNLGDLSGAEEIKLVVAGTILYSTGEEQGAWAWNFSSKPGEQPFPPPYMEVKDAEGNWVPVPDNRQFPLLDVTPDCFVVNLTGVFPTDDYSLRIHTFFNTRFDYIGVDTTSQQDVTIREVTVSSATLSQAFDAQSASTGNFTRYGDVTELMGAPDDMFVIMRQGDEIRIMFSADVGAVPEGMERDFFLFASVWFKVDGLPYVPFTVDPLPFHDMTCFPYPETEGYPYDAAHLAYLAEYNTRIITGP
ncbi:MAG: hypothetical protein CW716_00690 [Candidatus Bathyarchaeum sp.]|nr:MAG: hypothetical protein CW716_00690 [Candidatus Bathyarchaeum sp.]